MTASEYEQLVEFLGQRFAEIDRRFGEVDRRFDEIDHRFALVDRRFGDIDRRLTALDERSEEQFREILGHFDQLYRRLERLEQEYHAIAEALRRIERWMADETVKREVLERSVGELKRQVGALQARVEELEQRLRES